MGGVDQPFRTTSLSEFSRNPDSFGEMFVEVGVDHITIRSHKRINACKPHIQVVAEHKVHQRDIGPCHAKPAQREADPYYQGSDNINHIETGMAFV